MAADPLAVGVILLVLFILLSPILGQMKGKPKENHWRASRKTVILTYDRRDRRDRQ